MAGIGGSGRQRGAYYESRLNHRDRSTHELLEGMMSNLEQLQTDVEALPAEAQLLLMDFLEILKKRYPQKNQPESTADPDPYQQFQESGFIGCVSVEENLSTTYKQVLSETWGAKYDHR